MAWLELTQATHPAAGEGLATCSQALLRGLGWENITTLLLRLRLWQTVKRFYIYFILFAKIYMYNIEFKACSKMEASATFDML